MNKTDIYFYIYIYIYIYTNKYIYIYIYIYKWIGPQENMLLGYLFFFNMCFWHFKSSSVVANLKYTPPKSNESTLTRCPPHRETNIHI